VYNCAQGTPINFDDLYLTYGLKYLDTLEPFGASTDTRHKTDDPNVNIAIIQQKAYFMQGDLLRLWAYDGHF
jgi:hypothetical protein